MDIAVCIDIKIHCCHVLDSVICDRIPFAGQHEVICIAGIRLQVEVVVEIASEIEGICDRNIMRISVVSADSYECGSVRIRTSVLFLRKEIDWISSSLVFTLFLWQPERKML